MALQEWLDDNQHRVYPFTDESECVDSTGAMTLPTSLIVDMVLCAPPSADVEDFHLKSVVILSKSISIEIGYGPSNTLVGAFRGIPYDAAVNSSYSMEVGEPADGLDPDFGIMTGTLIIGSTTEALANPGSWYFRPGSADVLSTRVMKGLAGVRAIEADGLLSTGVVALKEGSGVTIEQGYDSDFNATVLTISADVGTLGETAVPITDDASIMANLVAMYGTPITKINGIAPDDEGNFTLRPVDCTSLDPLPNGLSVDNPCSLPCCDKSMLNDVYESLSQLNLRYARMQSYYESISRNVNSLQARMVSLEI